MEALPLEINPFTHDVKRDYFFSDRLVSNMITFSVSGFSH